MSRIVATGMAFLGHDGAPGEDGIPGADAPADEHDAQEFCFDCPIGNPGAPGKPGPRGANGMPGTSLFHELTPSFTA